MLSCDTMAVAAQFTRWNQNMLAKNSDRPTAEAQTLHVYPAQQYAEGATVQMTDLCIPQVSSTYAVIGSQPYWTWGFEMGMNEKGLIIGNEAQGSKNAAEAETGILGLDLLRLALERAATAREGVGVITGLLEKYGQNANASQLIDRRYENAYLLVDKNEIWLLETAGREWAAKRVEDRIGISNCYQIGEQFELCSAGAEERARRMRWLAPDEPFHFTKAYSKPAIRQTGSVPRMRRLNQLLAKTDCHDYSSLSAILRDHFDGEITEPRFGAAMGCFSTICMHMREWGESETTASIVSRIDEVLGVVSRYAMGQPCQSVYLPVYATGYLPAKLQDGGKQWSDTSLWWKCKRMSLLASVDEERFAPALMQNLRALEQALNQQAETVEKQAAALLQEGQKAEAFRLLNEMMDSAAAQAETLVEAENARIASAIRELGGLYGVQAENIARYAEYAQMPLL